MVWSVLLTFLTTLLPSVFNKKIEKRFCVCAEYSILITKIHYISYYILTIQFFEGQVPQAGTELLIKPFGRVSIKKSEFKQTNAGFFQPPFYFPFVFLDNSSHKFWEQFSSPHYQCCLQISEIISWLLLLFQYATTLSRGNEVWFLILQNWSFQSFHKFFQELDNLSEIL